MSNSNVRAGGALRRRPLLRPAPLAQEASEAKPNGDPALRFALTTIFVLALLIRLPDVWRPVDGTVRDSWRETDVAGIARNFYREGMNLFYPRIDWRGDGPGYTESEFPFYPWTAAALYHAVGYHEPLLRVISLALVMSSLAVFLRIAQRMLSPTATVVAALVYALLPMDVRMATTIHPEPLMYFAYLLAIDAFDRWLTDQRRTTYFLALGATALAILAKLPAAHVGVLFAFLTLDRWGLTALRRWDVWLFAAAALALPAAWYAHAHSLWLEYGNSLGISNESMVRISKLDFVRHLGLMIPGLLRLETQYVWMPTGALLGVWGLAKSLRDPQRRLLVYWAATLAIYYFLTCRTTGELWAVHYHIVTMPLAALLIARGCQSIEEVAVQPRTWRRLAGAAIVSGSVLAAAAGGSRATAFGAEWAPLVLGLAGAAGVVTAGVLWCLPLAGALRFASGEERAPGVMPSLAAAAVVALLSATWVLELFMDYRLLHPHDFAGKYHAAIEFRAQMSADALLVASGGPAYDSFGMPHAYNAPYYFFWTDHKGFTIADEQQSIEELEDLRQRGAKYFIGEHDSLAARPEFLDELRTRYRVLVERDEAVLVELTAPPS